MVIASGSKGLKGKKVFSIICISHKRKSNSQRKPEEICFREKLHGNRFWEKRAKRKFFSIICISHKGKSNSQRKTEEICVG